MKWIDMIKQKRGTHVGVIISFVIFMTFVVFLYVAVQPKITSDTKEKILEYVKSKIMGNVSSDTTVVSVGLIENPGTCVKLSGFFAESGMAGRNRIIVGDEEGQKLDSRISGNDLFVLKDSDDFFLSIYESENFAESGTWTGGSCTTLNEGTGYNFGIIKTSKKILEINIISLIDIHGDDYDELKQEFKIPYGNEFSFSFTYSNGTTAKTQERNVSISVFADEIQVRYINKNASEEHGFLNVKVW